MRIHLIDHVCVYFVPAQTGLIKKYLEVSRVVGEVFGVKGFI